MMEDDEEAISCIKARERIQVADRSLMKQKKGGGLQRLVHSAEFHKRFGVRASKVHRARERPIERGQWIKMKRDCGWPQAAAEEDSH